MTTQFSEDTFIYRTNMEETNNQIKFPGKLEKNKFFGAGNSLLYLKIEVSLLIYNESS